MYAKKIDSIHNWLSRLTFLVDLANDAVLVVVVFLVFLVVPNLTIQVISVGFL